MEPTPEMIEAAAQRLVRWEDGCTWPDSWDALTVAAARQDAERALRSALAVMAEGNDRVISNLDSDLQLEKWRRRKCAGQLNRLKNALSQALMDYANERNVHHIFLELKDVERDHT